MLPDSSISHYRILSKIGAGGMGEVYLAQDTTLDRCVALKILPQELAADADRMRRFILEAKSASALNHPNIITIYEIGETNGTNFIATEYIEGKTLNHCDSMTLTAALEAATQIASALQAAHSAGIVHRDIKPDNVMIRPDGLVKILDFGVAKLSGSPLVTSRFGPTTDPEAATAMKAGTSTGMIVGTANYMSPEQARGKTIDGRSDIFSFGVLLYEMITGRKPFVGENAMDVLGSIVADEPTPLSQLLPRLPPEVDRIVNKALSKDRERRYQTANELLNDLKSLQKRLEFQAELERSSEGDKQFELQTQIIRAQPTAQTDGHDSIAVLPFSNLSADPDNEYFCDGLAEEAHTAMLGSGKQGVSPPQTQSNEPTSVPAGASLRSTSPKRRSVLLGVGFILLLAIGASAWFLTRNHSTGQIESIAVMPFVNDSGDASVDYLSDGMTETLISTLSRIPKLSVKARSTVFYYKGKETAAKKLGEELKVQAVLLGRVVQHGDDLKLSLELVNTDTQDVIWSEQYHRNKGDLVNLQTEIARDVSDKLQTKLSGSDSSKLEKKYTASPEAYELYLKGRYHWNRRTVTDNRLSLDYFEKATKLDPNFALAYVGISDAHITLGIPDAMAGDVSSSVTLPPARAAAEKAIELDPTLAEAYASRGHVRWKELDWSGAESDFKRSIELNPNYPYVRLFYSLFLSYNGRTEEALNQSRRAVELDPYSIPIVANSSFVYYMARRPDEAIAIGKRAVSYDDTIPIGRQRLGAAYELKGMMPEAIAEFEAAVNKSGRVQLAVASLAHAYAVSGNKIEARKLLRELDERSKREFVSPYLRAIVHVALGENQLAIDLLEEAYSEHSIDIVQAKADPKLDPLRGDPRFQLLIKKLGFPS